MGPTKKSFAASAGRKGSNLWSGGRKNAGGFGGRKNRDDGSGGGDAAGTRREAGDRGGAKTFHRRRKNDADSGQQGNWSGRGGSSSARGQGKQSSWKPESKKSSGDKAPWLAKEAKEGKRGGQTREGRKLQGKPQKKALGGKGKRTDANLIEVNWKPPGAEDEATERDQPHGVTPKSGMPRKPSPSPVRGPAGRGAPLPAWKKKTEGAQLALPAPSIPGEAAEPEDRGDSPARGPAGRGRSEVKPAWMTRQEGNKEQAPPSIPEEDDKASDNHDNDERGRRSGRASRSRSGQQRKSWGGGGGSKGGRDDSRWWDENDWNSGNHWRDYGSRHNRNSWKDEGQNWRRGADKWHQADDKGSWRNQKQQQRGSTYSSSSTSKAYAIADSDGKDWDRDDRDDSLLCVTHQKRRSWDQLEGNKEGEWVCIRNCPCVVYVGGPKATKDLAAALEEWKRIVDAVEDAEKGQRRVFERGESAAKELKNEPEAKDLPEEGRNMLQIEDGTASRHETAGAPREREKEDSPPSSRRKVFVEKEKAPAGDANEIDQDDL